MTLVKNRYSALRTAPRPVERVLRNLGVDTVLVAGTKTDVCCDSTARDAMMLDFKSILVSDCCAALSDEEHRASLEIFIQQFGDVMTADEVLERLSERGRNEDAQGNSLRPARRGRRASAQETTLSAVVFVPRNTTFGEIFVRFVEQVNKEGKGLVQIKLRGGPDAIPTFEQGNALRTGVVDMVSLPPTFYTNVCPECDAQILVPQMTPQLRKTPFWGALQKYNEQKVNAQLLSAYGDGIGFHIWTSKPPATA